MGSICGAVMELRTKHAFVIFTCLEAITLVIASTSDYSFTDFVWGSKRSDLDTSATTSKEHNKLTLQSSDKLTRRQDQNPSNPSCYVQTCDQTITGRNLKYKQALEIVQSEEYLTATDFDEIYKIKRWGKFQGYRNRYRYLTMA